MSPLGEAVESSSSHGALVHILRHKKQNLESMVTKMMIWEFKTIADQPFKPK